MKLSRVAPASIWMHQAAGELNESRGYLDAAIREYREVLGLDPRRPGIHLRLGRTLLARAQQHTALHVEVPGPPPGTRRLPERIAIHDRARQHQVGGAQPAARRHQPSQ